METLFADTSFFVAYHNSADANHQAARTLVQGVTASNSSGGMSFKNSKTVFLGNVFKMSLMSVTPKIVGTLFSNFSKGKK